MAWIDQVDQQGQVWLVNWDNAYRILRSCVRAEATLKHARTVSERMFFLGPRHTRVEIDWNMVRAETDQKVQTLWPQFFNSVASSMATGREMLLDARRRAIAANQTIEARQKSSHAQSLQSMDSAVFHGECAVEVFKFIRDFSAGVLVTGATLVAGGAAAGIALAGGGLMKGVAKYQDTGNIGASIAEGSTEIVFGLIKAKSFMVGAERTRGGDIIMLVIGVKLSVGVEWGKAVLEGRSTAEALAYALGKVGLTKAFGTIPLDRMGFLGRVVMRNRDVATTVQASLSSIAAKKATGAAIQWAGAQPKPPTPAMMDAGVPPGSSL